MDLKYMKITQQFYLTCMHVNISLGGLQQVCSVFLPLKQTLCINKLFADKLRLLVLSAEENEAPELFLS